jgi:hypothetical protein
MARLSKDTLISTVLGSLENTGWSIQRLTPAGVHPAEFIMHRGDRRHAVRLYVWNLTHGGKSRSDDEFRIQITSGVGGFEEDPHFTTLILGWDGSFGVFAAFDLRQRKAALGSSPSVQISRQTLASAQQVGLAVQSKGAGEFASAVRPDRLAEYIERQNWVHSGMPSTNGQIPAPDLLNAAAEDRLVGHFGSREEREQRSLVLERLDVVERQIRELVSQPGARGHNNPPELIAEDAVAPLIEATQEIREELAKPAPNLTVIGRNATFLGQIQRTVSKGFTEAGKFAGQVKDKAQDKMAELIGGVLLGAGIAFGKVIGEALNALVAQIIHWLQLIL